MTRLRHRVLLVFGAPSQLRLLVGQEHGRTFALCKVVDSLVRRIGCFSQRGERLRRQLEDVCDDRNRWRSRAERLVLAAPVTTPAPAAPSPRRWWQRLAG